MFNLQQAAAEDTTDPGIDRADGLKIMLVGLVLVAVAGGILYALDWKHGAWRLAGGPGLFGVFAVVYGVKNILLPSAGTAAGERN